MRPRPSSPCWRSRSRRPCCPTPACSSCAPAPSTTARRSPSACEWDDELVDDLDARPPLPRCGRRDAPDEPGAPPAITMGAKGAPTHILQWRATWERDLAGKTGVDQIYPRVVHDVMPDDVLPPETRSPLLGRPRRRQSALAERSARRRSSRSWPRGSARRHTSLAPTPGGDGVNDGSTLDASALGLPGETRGDRGAARAGLDLERRLRRLARAPGRTAAGASTTRTGSSSRLAPRP